MQQIITLQCLQIGKCINVNVNVLKMYNTNIAENGEQSVLISW